MSTCTAAEIAEKKRLAIEKLRTKKLQTVNNNHATPTKQPAAPIQRSAAAMQFLNALKHNNISGYRHDVRKAAHPYQRSKITLQVPAALSKLSTNAASNNFPAATSKAAVAPIFVNGTCCYCKVYLISIERFAVQPSTYHAKLIDVLKKIPSKNYNTLTRIWDFPKKDYQLVLDRMKDLHPQVIATHLPKAVWNLWSSAKQALDISCLQSIEPTLVTELMPFQEEAVCFAIAQQGRIMLCDEMGLGKTYQALAIADYYREDWPLFICTTASNRESWAEHVRKLYPTLGVHYIQVLTSNQQYVGDAKVLITSYNMMERHVSVLLEQNFCCLIFDESHALKNCKAKCTKTAERLVAKAKRVILISGTPALSRPLELFTQMNMIDSNFMSFRDFTSRYCDGNQTHFGWDATGQSNLEELNVVLRLRFMVRRTKTEVLPQLAEKHRETIVLDPALIWTNEDTKESLDTFAKDLSASKGKAREEILIKYYAQTAKVKARAVCAYLKTVLNEKIKFIVFAHHRHLIEAICDFLYKSKLNFIRIDGSTKNEMRAEFIKSFQTNCNCKAAVLSLKACNSGITLTAAELIIFAELDWNPSTLAQAESRAHRIGQSKPVICRYLMANNTADDVIWNMLKNKQDTLKKAGIFCENLQEATHTTAPTSSNKMEKYFSPVKTNNKSSENIDGLNAKITTSDTNLTKELENIEELFAEDDDDMFEALNY